MREETRRDRDRGKGEERGRKMFARCDGETTLADLIRLTRYEQYRDPFIDPVLPSRLQRHARVLFYFQKLPGILEVLSFKTGRRPISRYSRSRHAEQSSVLSKSRDATSRPWYRESSEPFWRPDVMELDGKVQVWGVLENEKIIWLSINLEKGHHKSRRIRK